MPLADAVATVREAEQAGVAMTPFQVHQATGIRVGDAERVIREAQAPADAAQPDESATAQPSTPNSPRSPATARPSPCEPPTSRSDRERMPTLRKTASAGDLDSPRQPRPDRREASRGREGDGGQSAFNVITTKDGKAFAIKAAAQRELNARGLTETHEVVPAGDAGRMKATVRKKAPDQAGSAESIEVGSVRFVRPVSKRVTEKN